MENGEWEKRHETREEKQASVSVAKIYAEKFANQKLFGSLPIFPALLGAWQTHTHTQIAVVNSYIYLNIGCSLTRLFALEKV